MATAAEIQVELTEVKAAIKLVMIGQEYTFDSGQTKQHVKRANLKELMKWKQSLESDLSLAKKCEAGTQRGRGTFTRDINREE